MKFLIFRLMSVLFSFALHLSSSNHSNAVTLISNLPSLNNGSFGGVPDSADNFQTGNADLSITSVDIFWRIGDGGTSNSVGIFTDSSGLPSGTQVGGFFSNATPITSNTLINYVGNATLLANTVYWMVVDILDNSEVGFTDNQIVSSDPSTQGATITGPNPGSAYGDLQAVSWSVDDANLLYALNGTAEVSAIPVPAALPLLGTGLAVIGFIGWRRKHKLAATGQLDAASLSIHTMIGTPTPCAARHS